LPEFQWKKDRDGNILDEPVKVNDHATDSLCYEIYCGRGSLSRNKPAKQIDMSQLKIY